MSTTGATTSARVIAEAAALVSDLERRFVLALDSVAVGSRTYEILRPRNADDLISEADYVKDERLPYWADVWPSSIALAERVLEAPGGGARMLELGCGLGIVATAALEAGYDILATDYYADALEFARANAWRSLRRAPRTRLLDWSALPPQEELGVYDRVVAADVLYEARYAMLVANVLARTLSMRGVAWIADPGRVAVDAFLTECEARDLRVDLADVRSFHAGEIKQQIAIYRVERAAIV